MAEHDDKALELFNQGLSYAQIARSLNLTEKQVNHALCRARKRNYDRKKFMEDDTPLPEKVLRLVRKKTLDIDELSEKVGAEKDSVNGAIQLLRYQGYDIKEDNGNYFTEKVPFEGNEVYKHKSKSNRIKFGLVSDTHLCSRFQQLTYLNDLYDIFHREGIEKVYHLGDITDGEDLYKGHKYEVFKIGSDEQVDYAVENYPRREGIETDFITGNHDLCYYKKQGRDIGKAINAERDDLNYLGQIAAYVEIAEGVFMYLLHPDAGPSYAISYKPQRIAASFIGGEKPQIMALGHWHQLEYLFERNIHILQVPSLQGQTDYLRRGAKMPKIGGWIVEVEVENGSVKKFNQEAVVYFQELKNDF